MLFYAWCIYILVEIDLKQLLAFVWSHVQHTAVGVFVVRVQRKLRIDIDVQLQTTRTRTST